MVDCRHSILVVGELAGRIPVLVVQEVEQQVGS
jgi:hypothetical protein